MRSNDRTPTVMFGAGILVSGLLIIFVHLTLTGPMSILDKVFASIFTATGIFLMLLMAFDRWLYRWIERNKQ